MLKNLGLWKEDVEEERFFRRDGWRLDPLDLRPVPPPPVEMVDLSREG